MKTQVCSNSQQLTQTLIEQGLTIRAAAKLVKTGRQKMSKLVRADFPISIKLAGKLTRIFGVNAVKLVDPKRRELEQLIAMRAEFADRYPTDKARLETLDEMIRDARAEIEGVNQCD